MKRESINFHQTFYPNFDYIGKILDISDGIAKRTIKDISIITGIPTGESSGKVLPHIKYCEYMYLVKSKIIKGEYILQRTELGDLIYNEDPYFSESISRLVCHLFLTSVHYGSELWFFVYRSLQERYGNKISKQIVEHDIIENFNRNTKMTAYNSCYTNMQSLGILDLIDIQEDSLLYTDFKYEDEYFYGILYNLFKELKAYDSNRSEFTTDELFYKLNWNYALNWSQEKAIKYLEKTNEDGWIDLNRQLVPTTIILKKNVGEISSLIYSELI